MGAEVWGNLYEVVGDGQEVDGAADRSRSYPELTPSAVRETVRNLLVTKDEACSLDSPTTAAGASEAEEPLRPFAAAVAAGMDRQDHIDNGTQIGPRRIRAFFNKLRPDHQKEHPEDIATPTRPKIRLSQRIGHVAMRAADFAYQHADTGKVVTGVGLAAAVAAYFYQRYGIDSPRLNHQGAVTDVLPTVPAPRVTTQPLELVEATRPTRTQLVQFDFGRVVDHSPSNLPEWSIVEANGQIHVNSETKAKIGQRIIAAFSRDWRG